MTSAADYQILRRRPAKNRVDPRRPYAFHVERERSADGVIEPVATVFLTNRECPFRCAMCDLWKNTLDESVPTDAIPEQIAYALGRLPPARHIKLYNSGNFFDPRAIPRDSHDAIAQLVRDFSTVIVENHPRLCRDDVFEFRDRLQGKLEVAMGLETAHPGVLAQLNKQMTVDDYVQATKRLTKEGVAVRTFVLLRPPGMTEEEGVDWAIRSVQLASDAGSRCMAIIPTRAGNGYLDWLATTGAFEPPKLSSLERALEACLEITDARVFADLWDLQSFSQCEHCFANRLDRLTQMNYFQSVPAPVRCAHCDS